jgi:hypothetical protein
MNPVKRTHSTAPGNGRLTMRQTAANIGTNLGHLVLLRSKGSMLFDPTFPPMVGGTFDEAAISAWKKRRDEGGAP